MSAAPAYGFADPVFDAQRVFRAVMNALARPGSIQSLGVALDPPPGLPAGLAAIALTLADHETPLWLDGTLAACGAVTAYLRFHTGATLVPDPADAAFALVADPAGILPFDRFSPGTAEFPDRSTTLVLAVETLRDEEPLTLAGPGIAVRAHLAAAPRPADLAARLAANGVLFPRGVDLLFVTAREVVGLPRTTRIVKEA
jgi:alpha-D-ribose 1-methylphosphonate 5-triphosphate synthase subunit PhnH